MNALERSIEVLGSVSALATAIGVAGSLPSMWKARGRVPAEHCPAIERVTGGAVRCEELRPDVDWGVLRGHQPETAPDEVAGEVD
jgi:DNA-binding transcriptional regulator YdaS (Cro superfamily)